jgi:hypothetical protein
VSLSGNNESGTPCLLYTHRVCDGLSIFIVIKDVLRSLAGCLDLNVYEEISARDIIGGKWARGSYGCLVL